MVEFKRGRYHHTTTKATVISGSDRTDELPNRDASDFRLDEANLFLNNRFQGRDFILPGTHVAGGISGITSNSTIGDLTGFAGLSFKAQGKTPAGLTSSGREDYSDYIASLAMNTPFNLNLSWSGRADFDELKLNESHTSLDFTTAKTSLDVEHTQIAQGFFKAAEDDKEEAQLKLAHKLPNDVRLIGKQVWDLSSGETRQDQSAISAEWSGGFQNCVTLSLGYKRDAYVDRDIKKVSQLQLLLSFKYLGSVILQDYNKRFLLKFKVTLSTSQQRKSKVQVFYLTKHFFQGLSIKVHQLAPIGCVISVELPQNLNKLLQSDG